MDTFFNTLPDCSTQSLFSEHQSMQVKHFTLRKQNKAERAERLCACVRAMRVLSHLHIFPSSKLIGFKHVKFISDFHSRCNKACLCSVCRPHQLVVGLAVVVTAELGGG